MFTDYNVLEGDANYYKQLIESITDEKNNYKEYEFELKTQIDELTIKEKAMMNYNENLQRQLNLFIQNEKRTTKSFEKINH